MSFAFSSHRLLKRRLLETGLLHCNMHQARWYNKKALIVILHISCWLLLLALPFLLRPSNNGSEKVIQHINENFKYFIALKYLTWVGLFYFNAFVIVPGIIYRKRSWTYVAVMLGIFGVLFFFDWLLFRVFMNGQSYSVINFFAFNFFP